MFRTLVGLGALASLASALPSFPQPNLLPRAACGGNTPTTRDQWCDLSIDTDYQEIAPDTGRIAEHWLELTDVTISPDGFARPAITMNGTIPGPTIYADWGDTVVVHVKNSLTTSWNGSSIHFHGIRQNYTNQNDGVVAVTQCPIAVGETITYTWKAVQYGSTWYHSHFGLQAWEGVSGGIVINGPATANYNTDMGIIMLNDWSHNTVDELYEVAQTVGPPELENALINGTNVFDDGTGSPTGNRFTMKFTEGETHRLRLVNGAVDTHFKFTIDNHSMTVIAADLIPVKPYTATHVSIGIGQRIDVIVTADQGSVGQNFWARAIPQAACSDIKYADNVKGIVYYGDSAGEPTTASYEPIDGCEDETPNLEPHVSKDVDSATYQDLEVASVGKNSAGLFKWTLNSTSLLVDWADPVLSQVYGGATSFDEDDAVFQLPDKDKWVYFIIQTAIGAHPIHLHGHDYYVLAQGPGTFDNSVTLKTKNPPRRDTAVLPANGYLVMAWKTDNPGIWLMHCHIGWHTSMGFAVQFLERASEVKDLTDGTRMDQECSAWATFKDEHNIVQEDSGI